MPNTFKILLDRNKQWVEDSKKLAPEMFTEMAKGQSPDFLWIGCADSRVPANEITNSKPGSIFVQRNIANLVIHSDFNMLSVVNYAVKALKVKHIIICGHYGCGGIQAAMSNDSYGLLDGWLTHIKDVYRLHREELDAISDETERWNRYVELNVIEQVYNMSMISFIQDEWENGEFPYIHGWVYDLKEGLLKNLGIKVNSHEHLDKVYQYK